MTTLSSSSASAWVSSMSSSSLFTPQLVIFDWDGTLMNSIEQIVYCLMQMAQELQLPLDAAAAKDVIGLSLPIAMQRLFPECLDAHEHMIHVYAKYFVETSNHPAQQSQLFDGALELLDTLSAQQIPVAIATGKSRKGLDRVLAQTQTAHRFVATRTADETASKPHPKMLLEICQVTGYAPANCVMVGDTSYDLQMAQSIDMPRMGVTHGVHDASVLQAFTPLLLCDNLHALTQYFQYAHAVRTA